MGEPNLFQRIFYHCWKDRPRDRVQTLIDHAVGHGVELQREYIERMYAAYILETDVPPEHVALVRDTRGMWMDKEVFYFVDRRTLDDSTT